MQSDDFPQQPNELLQQPNTLRFSHHTNATNREGSIYMDAYTGLDHLEEQKAINAHIINQVGTE